ncbi:MAG TPA: thioredoxin domain-containing protein [Solirubrobacterales bacterium]|nr:thioredoxin domain-containing protein [Solirubrobacterales bacterium]
MSADLGGRKKRLWIGVGAGLLVLAAVLAFIVVDSSGDDSGAEIRLEGVAAVNRFFAGYPQTAAVIGDPLAPVEMVEYSDLQCEACRDHMEEVLPAVLENQVKDGAAKIDFRFMVTVGEQSNPAGAAAYAASLQGRGWNYIGIFFKNQKKANSGYAADDEFLEAVAEAAGVKDLDKWNVDRENSTTWVQENTEEGENEGLQRSPGVTIRGPKLNEELEHLGVSPSTKVIQNAIEAAH